uniref:Uncharacterized protein n=1 Tax=Arundo donax TaxID=35708 RepID=A0A0A9FY67_ARUDO
MSYKSQQLEIKRTNWSCWFCIIAQLKYHKMQYMLKLDLIYLTKASVLAKYYHHMCTYAKKKETKALHMFL